MENQIPLYKFEWNINYIISVYIYIVYLIKMYVDHPHFEKKIRIFVLDLELERSKFVKNRTLVITYFRVFEYFGPLRLYLYKKDKVKIVRKSLSLIFEFRVCMYNPKPKFCFYSLTYSTGLHATRLLFYEVHHRA